MNRYHDENMEWFRNLKPVRNDQDQIKPKRNIFAMAGFRPDSEIAGNFRKFQKFYGHFKRQKWRLQTNFWGVGVF